MYSRVGRVCKSDEGGPHKFRHKWTTFLKSRLNCSVPGEMPFYFDEIQSTSSIVGGDERQIFYGVFNTPENSIAGSAVCSFSMADVLRTFEESPFKNQETIFSNWLPLDRGQVPSPRPGQCRMQENTTLSESSLNFIKRHSMMDWAVPSSRTNGPVFVKTSMGERLTVIAVDPGVKSVDGSDYDVIFVGTTSGRILKLVHPAGSPDTSVTLAESIQVFPEHMAVRNLLVVRGDEGDLAVSTSRLIVLSEHEVVSVPLHRCTSASALSCNDCVALQDPYCAWHVGKELCVSHADALATTAPMLQNVALGMHADCPPVRQIIIRGE